jgi:hypothetical protein
MTKDVGFLYYLCVSMVWVDQRTSRIENGCGLA